MVGKNVRPARASGSQRTLPQPVPLNGTSATPIHLCMNYPNATIGRLDTIPEWGDDMRRTRENAPNGGDRTISRSYVGATGVPMLAVSVSDAALALGIGKSLAYDLVSHGVIPSVRLGNKRVVPLRLLEERLDEIIKVSGRRCDLL